VLNNRPRNLWIGFCLLAVLLIATSFDANSVKGPIWWILGLLCAAIIAAVAVVKRLWARSAWGTIAVGVLCYVIADMPDDTTPRLWAGPVPGSWVQNIAYGMSFVLFSVGAFVLVNRRRRNVSDISGFLDTAIVFVAASMAAAEYLIYPLWSNTSLSTGTRFLLILFQVLNLILLSATVRLWFATDRVVNRSVRILAAGFGVFIVGEAIDMYTWLPESGQGTSQHMAVTICGAVLFMLAGAAVLDPTAARPPAADIDAGLTARSRVLVLLGFCILVPPVLLLFQSNDSAFSEGRGFVLATMVLTGLVLLRVNLLVQGYREAVMREHMLREINAGLMRSNEMSDVDARLGDWAGQLIEQNGVECMLGTVDELSSAGIGPFGTRFRDEQGNLRYRAVVPVPGTRPQRRLVVDAPEIINSPEQASLAVLGQSVGMALERLELSKRVVERATTERLQMLLHNASDVIALVDDFGTVRYVTEAMRELTGAPPRVALGKQWPHLFEDSAMAKALLDRARHDGEATGDLVVDAEVLRVPTLPGEPETKALGPALQNRRVEVDVTWITSDEQFVVTHHDVTERYLLEQKLSFQAFHDELTGLNNRAVFRSEIKRAAARARRSGVPFAIMMLDLDDFKNVNDSLGHPAGDELLRVVASRLIECMREGDTPVRLGGDEFAAIMESASNEEDAEMIAQRILDSLTEPVVLGGTEVVVGASIGIAVSDGTEPPADTERDADIALYEAKFAGKNQVAVFHRDMHDVAVRKLSITNQLRGALERDEILVRYQPVIELATGAVAGAEALVRWNDPERGELVPDSFIGLAEDSGTIVDIGRFVITQALNDLADWNRAHPEHVDFRISINVSGRQLQTDNLARALTLGLRASGVRPQQVIIEVTESVLLPDDSVAMAQLTAIADLGISIYIDDFGTGWASLHYLRSLPVTGLKLAQEFVTGLPAEFDGGLARAIHQLGQSMQLEEVIAEGIETAPQRDSLMRLGYRLGQGYLLARPLMAAEMSDLLATRKPASWNLAELQLPLEGGIPSPSRPVSGPVPPVPPR